MQTINIIDPKTGQAHAIPYDKLPNALKSGGQFADEDQKKLAIKLQKNNYEDSGLLQEGNIDLNNRPKVANPETGGESTVWSMSIGTPNGEVLIPRVSDDGKILTPDEATDQFHKTGKHLGIFDNPDQATKYAKKLHKDQEQQYMGNKPLELELTKGQAPKEATGWKALGADALRLLGRSLKSGVSFARRAPGNLKEIGSDLIHHPLSTPPHIAQQVLAGLGEGVKGLANIPHEIFDELANKEITPNWLRTGSIPEDTGVEKFLGLEPTKKSDELLRALSAIYGGGKLLQSGVGKIKKVATAPNKEKLFQRALEKRIDEAGTKADMSESALNGLKDSLKLDYSKIHGETLGSANPVSLQEGINVEQSKLAEKKPLTEIPEQAVGEIPPEPDTKAIIDQKKSALEKAKSDADKALGTLDNPRLKGGAKVKKAIEEVKTSASDLYKSARAHYVDQKIVADNGAEIKSVINDLNALKEADELAPGYGSGTAEQKALEAQLEALKGEKVNASDIFDLQRTLEKMADDTRKKQFSGVNDIEFKRLNGLAERLESHAGTLEKRLESVGGKEVQSMIKEANKGWKTFKDLSKRNPVGKAALKGELPTRAMIEIAKDHPGNDFLHALVESDPELKKHMLAAYAGESNVNKLLKPTSLTKKYIESLPEVEEHVNSLKEALQGVKEGEVKASRVKKEYDDLVKSMKDAAKEQKVRRDAIEESDKLKKQIKFKEDALPKIEAKMKEVETNSAEHKRLHKELDEYKKFIQDKGGRLKELAKFFVKVKAAGAVHL